MVTGNLPSIAGTYVGQFSHDISIIHHQIDHHEGIYMDMYVYRRISCMINHGVSYTILRTSKRSCFEHVKVLRMED